MKAILHVEFRTKPGIFTRWDIEKGEGEHGNEGWRELLFFSLN